MTTTTAVDATRKQFLPRTGLDKLIQLLRGQGYTVIGPTVLDSVIAMREIESAADLPHGYQDTQDGGLYRLQEDASEMTFDFVVGPDGVKRYLFPPTHRLMQIQVLEDRFDLVAGSPEVPKLAFLGIRGCDLAAMKIQDRVFAYDDPSTFRCESEPWYGQARRNAFYIAVNCSRPGGACFCTSWGTGPEAQEGFDLALTELRDGFVLSIGSERGKTLAEHLPLRDAAAPEVDLAELKIARAAEQMSRNLDTRGLKRLLDENIEHPVWDSVAERCLACGNCTMVCPTCFCSTVTDATDLADGTVTRTREWESCFTQQFSYAAGGGGRDTIRARYRHWLRHKLCTWWDQFETSGCVGCGRCITWCPVAIDLTEEVARIRAAPAPALPEAARPKTQGDGP